MGAVGGTLGYIGFAGALFIGLIMIAQVGHAINPPKIGDVVNSNSICDITGKHIVLDCFGMYDYYVTCSNGITYSMYDYDSYDSINEGSSVWVRMSSMRARTGLTMDSWLNVTYATTNVENAYIITGGDVAAQQELNPCIESLNLSEEWKYTAKNTPFMEQVVCLGNRGVAI